MVLKLVGEELEHISRAALGVGEAVLGGARGGPGPRAETGGGGASAGPLTRPSHGEAPSTRG